MLPPYRIAIWALLPLVLITSLYPTCALATNPAAESLQNTVEHLAALKDRSTGSPGSEKAAAYILSRFKSLGLDTIETQRFRLPVLRYGQATLSIPGGNSIIPIASLYSNVITPQATGPRGISGPLIYVADGDLTQFNGHEIKGSVILMDIDSGHNWLHAANLGASALIYVDPGKTPNILWREKIELTPLRFPRFRVSADVLRAQLATFDPAVSGVVLPQVHLHNNSAWKRVIAENIYAVLKGTDPKLDKNPLIIEAFYDSAILIGGHSPGADESLGIATLLEMARKFKRNPPARTIIFMATAGHDQTLAGMREMIWSLREKSRNLRRLSKRLKAIASKTSKIITELEPLVKARKWTAKIDDLTRYALKDQIKTEVDTISRQLMQLRLSGKKALHTKEIKRLASHRLKLRRLGWQSDFTKINKGQQLLLNHLAPGTLALQRKILTDVSIQIDCLQSSLRLRSFVPDSQPAAIVSLHLSSHGNGIGPFNKGWLYPLKKTINRVAAYSTIDQILRRAAKDRSVSDKAQFAFQDTLRPNRRRMWQSFLPDHPALGGEVSALAGWLGLSLVTTHDSRSTWGTDEDDTQAIDWQTATVQAQLVATLLEALANAKTLFNGDVRPRNGFSTVSGQSRFLRHGELFPDQPAPGSVILAYQGATRHYAMTDSLGNFWLKGVADKKHLLHKVLFESYRFDPESGKVKWAIDKKKTGKPAYRLKIRRRKMETELVMFSCRQSTLFNLLEPRNFRYMTKINLLEARRESRPERHWWSRIDTRASTLTSLFLEAGTHYKLTLSDTVIGRKLVLINADPQKPTGKGYLVDKWPALYHTEFKVAKDMWTLLNPRIGNLEKHGIVNARLRRLQKKGLAALEKAKTALAGKRYDQFIGASNASWALAIKVYDRVEKTQKDVLMGVLFYIALFVPFAFCLERFLFGYSSIYKRIIAFGSILLAVIFAIYQVHPAFQLAYNPLVVILAFFIMGLSLVVILIIYSRFETEMIHLQRRVAQKNAEEISRWHAFVAAFLLGVSNLRRRRLRTLLTCSTLIILTFTIMSFTSVKTARHHSRLFFQPHSPYQGILLKNVNWRDLPQEAVGMINASVDEESIAAPRVWLEAEDRTRSTRLLLSRGPFVFEAHGAIGLSHLEVAVTGLNRILTGGRWFAKSDQKALIISQHMARELNINPQNPADKTVNLWGQPFRVVGVFDSRRLKKMVDLDGEPLTPAIFPSEITKELTEVEMEALESGEDVRNFQSRYQHIDPALTVLMPHRFLLSAGGHLKGMAMRSGGGNRNRETARQLIDRFSLSIFSGEKEGTYLYHASDTIRYSGVPNIIIPLCISIFIVLNTMIGSVFERKREIAIYTSVGLAPSHVAFLFIAEAMALAALSVVLGYLLAQISAVVFGSTALWAGITVNYSSLAGVAAMVLVILVVLISAIYPARVAAKIAIPDVNRSWSLPLAVNDTLLLRLPFLTKPAEYKSVGGFLLEYLVQHQDVSHGLFSSEAATPFIDDGAGMKKDVNAQNLAISSRIWLAPFDLGIMQQVAFRFQPSEEEKGFLEIEVELIRKAGEVNVWRRINKAFLLQLRKQLLIWRSLDSETKTAYQTQLQKTLTPAAGKGSDG